MKNKGIELNMDMANMSMLNGSAKQISKGSEDNYVTRIDMMLPFSLGQIPCKNHKIQYNNKEIDILITLIENKTSDPLLRLGGSLHIGVSNQSGLSEIIPLEIFTDNRGRYPALLASVVFPYRIASWTDDSYETGLKKNYDYEAIQVSGIPDNEEKIKALVVINRLLKKLEIPDERKLKYDDITFFSETYFKKGNFTPILLKLNALASKTAYKNAIEYYYLTNLEKTDVLESIENIHRLSAESALSNEKDLFDLVNKTIDEVLVHNIEFRRWVEPFWDGERKIIIKGNKYVIPRVPKKEPKIQPTLHVLLDMALRPLGIHVLRESDEGIGLLDFRFLYTTKGNNPISVAVEFKVAHHKKIRNGITRQLPAYLKSIRSRHGAFVVMWFKDEIYFKEPRSRDLDQMIKWLSDEAKKISNELNISVSSKVINASIRPSASNE